MPADDLRPAACDADLETCPCCGGKGFTVGPSVLVDDIGLVELLEAEQCEVCEGDCELTAADIAAHTRARQPRRVDVIAEMRAEWLASADDQRCPF